ncbi:efflux RND transporter periplasmic adaptor subunit [Oxalobacteraceae bacterium A2-2]
MKMNQRTAVMLIVLAGALLAAAILSWKKTPADAPQAQEQEQTQHAGDGVIAMSAQQLQGAGITLATAGPATITEQLQLPGEVRFNDDLTAHIVPRTPGVAVSVAADLGQHVNKGQVLAVISSTELADLRSASLAAQKRLALAQSTYQREKKLWEDKISAEQDYLQAQTALREAEIAAQTARAKLAALGAAESETALSRYVLRAPFDGVVVEKHIAQGEAVKEDANVFLLSDLSSVWVEINVTARDLESVRVGQAMDITSGAGGASATGTVSYVGSLLGEQTRSAKARVVIANPRMAWRPGLFVTASTARGARSVPVAVAAEAVHTVEGASVVYLKVERGFRAQPVQTGASDGKLTEITAGLPAGARYAAAGSFVLKAEQGKDSAGHEH